MAFSSRFVSLGTLTGTSEKFLSLTVTLSSQERQWYFSDAHIERVWRTAVEREHCDRTAKPSGNCLLA
jgi:hypothetical protein